MTATLRRSTARIEPEERAPAAARWLLAGVAVAAGIVGVVMVIAPGSTGSWFSWPITPPALAGLIGGCYVASAAIFGWAAWREPWATQRGLCVAVLGLAGPTLVATARHHATFDLHRWQAVAWVVLFVASLTSFGTLVWRRPAPPVCVCRRARRVLVGTAVSYGAAAVVLWVAPGVVDGGPMAVRYVGSWCAFLGLGAWYASTHPAARLNVAALGVYPLAAVAGAVAA